MKMIGKAFGEIAHKYHMHIQSCAEKVDLSMYGIEARPCMNMEDITQQSDIHLKSQKVKVSENKSVAVLPV